MTSAASHTLTALLGSLPGSPIACVCVQLLRENEPDPLDAEQTWPTEAELAEAEDMYQQVWALDLFCTWGMLCTGF